MADFDINDPSFSEILPSALTVNDKFLADGRSLRLFVIALKMLDRQYHTGTQSAATISDIKTTISNNVTVLNNTNVANSAQGDATNALADAATALGVANSAQSDATSAKDKTDQITITAATDLDAIRTKVGNITITDNGSIITNAQIALLASFLESVTKQSISGTGVQSFDLSLGQHADVTISGAIDLNFSNGVASKNGLIFCSNTNGNTLDLSGTGLTFKKRGASGLLEAYSQITLSAGAADEQVIAYHFRTSTEVIYAID